MLDFKTAGESHGKGLLVIVDGIPAGIDVDLQVINHLLSRRQGGYGRGGRMKIESDRVDVYSGIRDGKTIGSPVGFVIHNKDWENWKEVMAARSEDITDQESIELKKDERIREISPKVTQPRPGHADLAGILKYNFSDIRNILERASARETAARTAVGGLLKNFLAYFDIDVISHVLQIGSVQAPEPDVSFSTLKERVMESPVNCYDQKKEQEMMSLIRDVAEEGDTLGGVIELITTPLPVGLGTHTVWKERLDSRLAGALVSIPAIKGVEIGPAFANAGSRGSQVHDEIFYDQNQGYYRKTNRAGGTEGGISNGQPLKVRIAMKPLATLYQPMQSVDIKSKEPFSATVERSDVTAVPACGVVGEAMVSIVLSRLLLDKFGGDHIDEIMNNYDSYQENLPGGSGQ